MALSACGSHKQAPGPSPAPAPARGPVESIFESDVTLDGSPGPTLDQLRKLGVDRVRVIVAWGSVPAYGPSIAPNPDSPTRPQGFNATDPAAYSQAGWAVYDRIDREAAARGIGVDFTLSSPVPLWASGPGVPHRKQAGFWRPSATGFGEFVKAAGTRYSGQYKPAGATAPLPRVSFWGIWNEPNLGPFLAPQATNRSTVDVSPRYYRALVDAAWSALQATGHGSDTILIGELAPDGYTVGNNVPGIFGYMAPLRFVRDLYCVGPSYQQLRGAPAAALACPTTAAGSASFAQQHPALFHASAFALHLYTLAHAPNLPTPDEPDYADLPALPKVEPTLDRIQQLYGSSTKFPIYNTEFGYHTNPPETDSTGIPPDTAAEYMNWAEYISWKNPRVRSYDQYLLTDGGTFATGLYFPTGQPKPGYAAYRMPLYLPVTAASKDQPVEVWGCVRPARYAQRDTGKQQKVELQFQPSGGQFKTVQTVVLTDPYGYFDVSRRFQQTGTVRLTWSYPHGPQVFSRAVAVTIR
jgi:hypothetical protein